MKTSGFHGRSTPGTSSMTCGRPFVHSLPTPFRDAAVARGIAADIHRLTTRPWRIMEVCGGQTHAILRSGIDQLLPAQVELIHGPGCPVCVTPLETIDRALAIARQPGVIFCSFGDMLRVPGSRTDLLRVRAGGGDVRVVASPLDAVRLAEEHPDREVVFFAVGFETTAPATAWAARLARGRGLGNFSMLVAHVLVPPAIDCIAGRPRSRVHAFLAAGHVCSVMGTWQYPALAERHRVPIVVTGFEPVDLLDGIRRAIMQLETGRHELENAYARVVRDRGNELARGVIEEVFVTTDRSWRGLGPIPASGWRLADAYRAFDAERRFAVGPITATESPLCRSGEVLAGLIKPAACPAFGRGCTPATPLGATMVSSEGACAAAFHAGRAGGPSLSVSVHE
jgi:hydrogenase expression/formation protein HypD